MTILKQSLPTVDSTSTTKGLFMMMVPEEQTMVLPSISSFPLLLSVGTGTIDWSNPVEAVFGGITLIYFAFSIWAGLKYLIKDGWRPKL
jgi:hypothetical protein